MMTAPTAEAEARPHDLPLGALGSIRISLHIAELQVHHLRNGSVGDAF
jgi:hypothetical protein